jgi:hypothetical protein
VTGVAVFDARSHLLRAIADAKAQGLEIVTTFMPAYDAEIVAATGVPPSAVPAWTLAGGVAGATGGLAMTVWMALQWPILILGGKPLVSLPTFLIIAFELTILGAVCAAVVAFLFEGRRARRIGRAAYDPSLIQERFGLVVRGPSGGALSIRELMMSSGAVTWRVL